MAGTKFSQFTGGANADSDSRIVGYQRGGTTNNVWTPGQLAAALTSEIPSIYSTNSSLAGARTVTMGEHNLDFASTTAGQLVTFGQNVKISGQAYNDGVYDMESFEDGGIATPDWNNGNIQQLLIESSGGAAAITIDNAASSMTPGATYILIIVQGGTDAGTVSSWGSHYKFPGGTAPTLTSGTANSADVITMVAYSVDVLMCTSTLNFETI